MFLLGWKDTSFAGVFKHAVTFIVLATFLVNPLFAQIQPVSSAAPIIQGGRLLLPSAMKYDLPTIVGMRFDSYDMFHFAFILRRGSVFAGKDVLRPHIELLNKYFLAALTIPEKDLWVNLSPYEPNKIIPDKLGRTELGKGLLQEDYILKCLSASLTHPDTASGRLYWSGIDKKSLSKIWITPGKIHITENGGYVMITEASLKVKAQADFPAMRHILPLIEKEVNYGRHFAQLRQMYSAVIMAGWFKRKLRDTILARKYFDQGKIKGAENKDPHAKDEVYRQYLEAFNRGVYDYVKQERYTKRNYFCGGVSFKGAQNDAIVQGEMPDMPTKRYDSAPPEDIGAVLNEKTTTPELMVVVNDMLPISTSGSSSPDVGVMDQEDVDRLFKSLRTGQKTEAGRWHDVVDLWSWNDSDNPRLLDTPVVFDDFHILRKGEDARWVRHVGDEHVQYVIVMRRNLNVDVARTAYYRCALQVFTLSSPDHFRALEYVAEYNHVPVDKALNIVARYALYVYEHVHGLLDDAGVSNGEHRSIYYSSQEVLKDVVAADRVKAIDDLMLFNMYCESLSVNGATIPDKEITECVDIVQSRDNARRKLAKALLEARSKGVAINCFAAGSYKVPASSVDRWDDSKGAALRRLLDSGKFLGITFLPASLAKIVSDTVREEDRNDLIGYVVVDDQGLLGKNEYACWVDVDRGSGSASGVLIIAQGLDDTAFLKRVIQHEVREYYMTKNPARSMIRCAANYDFDIADAAHILQAARERGEYFVKNRTLLPEDIRALGRYGESELLVIISEDRRDKRNLVRDYFGESSDAYVQSQKYEDMFRSKAAALLDEKYGGIDFNMSRVTDVSGAGCDFDASKTLKELRAMIGITGMRIKVRKLSWMSGAAYK